VICTAGGEAGAIGVDMERENRVSCRGYKQR
jgi:hypothetical protein